MDLPMDKNAVFEKESVLKIDKTAFAHNIKAIREITSARLIAVVKENGYGLGLEREYRILCELGLDFFAVTNGCEALVLRELGCTAPILIMSPILDIQEARSLLEADITFMLGSKEQASLLKALSKETGLIPRVHIKIETGMGRYGFLWNELPDFSSLTEGLSVEGCYSHLSGNPRRYEKNAREQARRLRTAIDVIKSQGIHPTLCHLSNSQGVMTLGDLGFDAVRVGSALIGKAAGGGSRLKPAVWLEAKIYEKIRRKKGQTVGYQSTAVLKHDSVLGLVRIGHGDGIYLGYADTPEKFIHGCIHLLALRLLPGRYKKTVQVQGRSLPIVGRLGIAHMVIDLSGTDVQIGDTVKLSVNPLLIHPAVPREFVQET